MKEKIIEQLAQITNLKKEKIFSLIETPPSRELGDYAFPCFVLSPILKKSPQEIALELSKKISFGKFFERVEAKGSYLNFFLNREILAGKILKRILKEKEKYGTSSTGKGKTIVIDMSSPNIAKPFGVGHLRSTIIGGAIANIAVMQGFKVVKINYLGDWGTPFGKIIAGYKKWGNPKKLEREPIRHLYDIYVRASHNKSMEEEGRQTFKKLESGDKKTLAIWKKFRTLSLQEFNKLYKIMNIKFDVISGESKYNNKMQPTIQQLKQKNLLEESDGAFIVRLEEYNLGICLIQKSDGTTLYATRDITAAIDRYKKYKFAQSLYEVGQEQRLHFKQFFKVLELMGYKWAKNCVHVDHGLYLDADGKKFATRHGKTIFMEEIIEETKNLAKKEIAKREKISEKELENRALKIALAAIFYGDLKNHRSSDVVFDIQRFLSFEGNTGPYLLYTYARARSILRKSKKKISAQIKIPELNDQEKNLILKLERFPEKIEESYSSLAPNLIANYAFELAQAFNEFYHAVPVIGSEQELFRLAIVESCAQVLKNALALLGISAIEKM